MLMVVIKIVVTSVMVLGLAWLSERAGPKTAGVLAGFPLGIGVSLFFIGVEQGSAFAAVASTSTIGGLGAALIFCFAYWQISKFLGGSLVHWFSYWKVRGSPVLWSAFLTSLGSFVVFVIAAGILAVLPQERWLLTVITLVITGLAIVVFRRIDDVEADATQAVAVTPLTLLIRAAIASAIVLVITGLADAVGEAWSGLLSGFPITLYPVLLIVHVTYSERQVHGIIKNFPFGIGSLLIFALAGSYVFESMGMYWGTAVAILLAGLYLSAVAFIMLRRRPSGS
ncbi:MAG: hypothetical protein AAF563_17250 [Pseudomonadota bacterium]